MVLTAGASLTVGYPDYMPYDKFLRNFQPVADIKSAPPATGANADETNVQVSSSD